MNKIESNMFIHYARLEFEMSQNTAPVDNAGRFPQSQVSYHEWNMWEHLLENELRKDEESERFIQHTPNFIKENQS